MRARMTSHEDARDAPPGARRAIDETLSDAYFDRTGGMAMTGLRTAAAVVRVVAAFAFTFGQGHPMRNLGRDVRYALRRLRATPVFTAFAVVTLALGMGAATAVYSTVYTVMLRPPDVPNLNRVVEVRHSRSGSGPMRAMSWLDYRDLRQMQSVFDRMSVTLHIFGSVAVPGQARQVIGEAVSGEYFDIMGLQPAAGRLIQPADDEAAATPVAVLSDRLWNQLFGRSQDAIASTVKVDGLTFTVAGVAPASYRGGNFNSALTGTDLWVPLEVWVALQDAESLVARNDRELRSLHVKARLAPGKTIEEAETEVRHVGGQLDEAAPIGRDMPERNRSRLDIRAWAVVPLRKVGLAEQEVVWGLAVAAIVAVLLVLLVACTNLANLLLARHSSRRHEMAIRLALGASKWRLLRESLVESAALAVAGGASGIVVAAGMVAWLTRDLPISANFTLALAPSLDTFVLALAAGATIAAFLVFGVVPALASLRAGSRTPISGGDGTGSAPRWRGRRWLIVGQVTVSVVLVLLAALSTQHAALMATEDVGIDLDRIAVISTRTPAQDNPIRVRQLFDEVGRQLQQQPGIGAVTVASGLPLGQTPGASLRLPDVSSQAWGARVELVAATPSVFATLGAPVSRGRPFDERDTAGSERVVVLSQAAAERLFSDEEPLGRRIEFQRRRWVGEPEHPVELVTVIGVAGDRGQSGRERETLAVYLPLAQHHERALWLIARTAGDPAALLQPMRDTMTRVAPEISIAGVGTGMQMARPELLFFSVMAGLTAALGSLALLLALAGLFGVLAHIVARRTREIGIRMALGAEARQIVRLVIREGMSPVLLGVIAGTAFGIVARLGARPMSLALLPAVDIWAVVVVPVPMLLAGLLACYVPARRAASVDPNVALRDL
jgi:predicted permease